MVASSWPGFGVCATLRWRETDSNPRSPRAVIIRVDMRSRSRRRYTSGFQERIVARVPVTALLQRGYTVRDNVRKCADEA